MREIILDTETTGLNPQDGHRIVEIGGLEMVNRVATGRTYHVYINPERDIPPDAQAIHGISNERIANEPIFADLVDGFLEFIEDSPLIIHNAPFDMGFINAELLGCDRSPLPMERAVDTLAIARRKFPGAQASLDALCKRFNIDNSHRSLHGAMIDTDLLAEVYIELMGGRQPSLTFSSSGAPSEAPSTTPKQDGEEVAPQNTSQNGQENIAGVPPKAGSKAYQRRPHAASEDERQAHQAFIKSLKDPLWNKIGGNKIAGEN